MLLEALRTQVLRANQEIARRGLAPHTFGNASGIDRSGTRAPRRHQAQRRRLRHHASRRSGRHRSRRQHRRRHAAPLERSRHPYPSLSRVPPDRRHRPHPLRVRHILGPGRPPHPLLRHHPRRLLPRPRPRHRAAHRRGSSTGYVRNTGAVIVRRFRAGNLDPIAVPGVLVAGHAPFAWGRSAAEAVEHADCLEYIARLAFRTVLLNASATAIPVHVSEHHYLRKHGPKATYGQR